MSEFQVFTNRKPSLRLESATFLSVYFCTYILRAVRQVRGKRDRCLYLLPYRRWRVVPALASCTGAGETCTGAGELYRRWRDLHWHWRVVPALARYVPAIWPRGKQSQGYLTNPGKPLCTLLTEGAGGP